MSYGRFTLTGLRQAAKATPTMLNAAIDYSAVNTVGAAAGPIDVSPSIEAVAGLLFGSTPALPPLGAVADAWH